MSSSRLHRLDHLILTIAHTDPSLDFFEVGWPLKYKRRYAHYLNQRVFYEVEESPIDKAD